ncbi:Poly(beta-D-mannuronate) C5 epimerase 7 [compost metagenome]
MGATGANFTPGAGQVGQLLRVVASFTDDQGFANTAISAATAPAGGLFTAAAGGSTLTGTIWGDMMIGGVGNDVLGGREGDDVLTGGAGDDFLNGWTGADQMSGGTGNDVFIVHDALDVVIELAGQGTDQVQTFLTNYTLGANLENLRYVGTANFTGVGNTLGNTVVGAAGNDTLGGREGNDLLIGGAGDDFLNGWTGNDQMLGGTGNDVFIVHDALDVVVEQASEGTDQVQVFLANYTLGTNVENLRYLGTTAFTGVGNTLGNTVIGGAGNDTLGGREGSDILTGGAGDDFLNGWTGADQMSGGTGNDVFIVHDALDVVIELAGQGTDQVQTFLANYTLGTNVENLRYMGAANFTGVGNGLSNTMQGGTGNDSLTGGLGNDVFRFAAGFGQDRILDFDANPAGGQDRMDIASLGITAATFAANVVITDVGADTRVAIGANSITLVGVADATTVTQADFTLG